MRRYFSVVFGVWMCVSRYLGDCFEKSLQVEVVRKQSALLVFIQFVHIFFIVQLICLCCFFIF